MDFRFTAEQQAFRTEVRDFCRRHVTEEVIQHSIEEGTEHAPDLYAKMAGEGWLGLDYPAIYGGLEHDQIHMGIFREETAYFDAPLMTHEVNNIIAHSIIKIGSDQQKQEFVTRVAQGDIIFCMGYTEPEHGSDLAGLKTRAVLDGDRYVIDGQKIFSTNAHIADYVFLAARTDDDAPKHRGISLFIVPMDTPGISVGPLWTMGGWRVNTIYFDGVSIPASTRVGDENDGWKGLAVALNIERSGLMYVGKCRRMLDEFAEVIEEQGRQADPGVRGEIADLRARIRASRLLSYRVAWLQAQGEVPNHEASMAKLAASELATRIADRAVNLLGPDALVRQGGGSAVRQGFFEDHLRWSLMGTIVAGTSEIQRSIIAQRGLALPRGA